MQAEKHWKYETVNDAYLSMHDRHIKDIRFESQQLFLSLDSLCMLPGHPENPTDNAICTGPAEICFHHVEQAAFVEYTTRCLRLFSHQLSPAWWQTWHYVSSDEPCHFRRMVSHVISMQPEIYEEMLSTDGWLRTFTCALMNDQGGWRSFLTLAKLDKQKYWHVFLGSKAFEGFERLHKEDELDIKEFSFIRNRLLTIRLELICSQSNLITYRWNEIDPEGII